MNIIRQMHKAMLLSSEQNEILKESIFQNLNNKDRSPTLRTINTLGVKCFGSMPIMEHDGNQVNISIYAITALFLPIIPIKAYIHFDGYGSYRFIGSVPLSIIFNGLNVHSILKIILYVILESFVTIAALAAIIAVIWCFFQSIPMGLISLAIVAAAYFILVKL